MPTLPETTEIEHQDEQEIYVVVAERDTYDVREDSRPIVFETCTDTATLENAQSLRDRVGNRYGKTRIAKLQFID